MGVNRSRVLDKDDFILKLSDADKGDNVLLMVVRGGRDLFVAFTI